jgi:peroxiredoxin
VLTKHILLLLCAALCAVCQVKDCGIVLFAYPKANTKGCTSQAVGLSEKADELAAAGYRVYGISADKPKSQANWRSKENLAFNLLCDPSYEVCTCSSKPPAECCSRCK